MTRGRKLKTHSDIQQLPEDSTDIFHDNFTDTHYPNHPKELEDIPLCEFSKHFDVINKKPVIIKNYKKKNQYFIK